MRNKLLIAMAVLLMGSSGLFALQEAREPSSPDIGVNLDFRSLQRGEIVRVSVAGKGMVKMAEVLFMGRTYRMGLGQDPDTWLAFLGLDLGIKKGPYPVEISILFVDGHHQNIRREILVHEKEFPIKKLWVKQEFVTPPREVLDRIQWESELLAQVYGIFTPQWFGEGPFIIPSEGEVSPNFGERRMFNNEPRSPHSGVDISSPFGAPVRASNSGRIVLAKDLYFAGKTVVIDHGLGVFTLYCHFSKIVGSRGEMVKKGDIIGEIGATGRVTGPHLHWGVKVSGNRVDPLSLLHLD